MQSEEAMANLALVMSEDVSTTVGVGEGNLPFKIALDGQGFWRE